MQIQHTAISGATDVTALNAIWPDDQKPGEPNPLRQSQLGFLAPIVEPLAALLATKSEFPKRPRVIGGEGPPETSMLTDYLLPLVHQYVLALPSLDVGSGDLASELASQLAEAATSTTVRCSWQLALTGVSVQALLEYRDVVVRPLSPTERGALVGGFGRRLYTAVGLGELEVPYEVAFFLPDVLLKATTSRPQTEIQDHSTLMTRLVMSFLLSGFDLGSTGQIMSADYPRFLSFGTVGTPVPIDRRQGVATKELTEDVFEAIVDRAYSMPDFAMGEGTRKDLVLQRFMKGCGAKSGGFLDFAICLEAALLGGVKDELRFKFRLFGALFLATKREANQSYKDFATIYDVRSDLVHGTPVAAAKLHAAEVLAREYAVAVVRRCVEDAWPNTDALTEQALSFKPENSNAAGG